MKHPYIFFNKISKIKFLHLNSNYHKRLWKGRLRLKLNLPAKNGNNTIQKIILLDKFLSGERLSYTAKQKALAFSKKDMRSEDTSNELVVIQMYYNAKLQKSFFSMKTFFDMVEYYKKFSVKKHKKIIVKQKEDYIFFSLMVILENDLFFLKETTFLQPQTGSKATFFIYGVQNNYLCDLIGKNVFIKNTKNGL